MEEGEKKLLIITAKDNRTCDEYRPPIKKVYERRNKKAVM